jgi:hypothetical protein
MRVIDPAIGNRTPLLAIPSASPVQLLQTLIDTCACSGSTNDASSRPPISAGR